jgi:hypothetical protein
VQPSSSKTSISTVAVNVSPGNTAYELAATFTAMVGSVVAYSTPKPRNTNPIEDNNRSILVNTILIAPFVITLES